MNFVRRKFPWLFPAYNIIIDYIYDMNRFIIYNTNNDYRGDKKKHEAVIIRMYHGIEKAFSLPHIKIGFGQINCLSLIDELSIYYSKYGYSDLVKISLDVLNYYVTFHKNHHNIDISKIELAVHNLITEIKEYNINDIKIGGVHKITKDEIRKLNQNFSFEQFSALRYSIRDFEEGNVSSELIKKAVKIALKTPSVCNRQGWKVHYFTGEKAKNILNYQNGSGGFKDSVETVLLVTASLTSFSNIERNQAYIDGGLFSMSLIYALHGLSLGVCPLNTSYHMQKDKEMHKAIDLPMDEVPIMMLAVGNLKDSFYVANSHRKDYKEILRINCKA